MHKTRLVTAITGCAMLLTLTGCGIPTIADGEINLSDSVLALGFSVQTHEMDPANQDNGIIVLVDSKGNSKKFSTEGMDVMHPIWNASGLFVSDLSHEMLITKTSQQKVTRNQTQDLQVSGFAILEDAGYVAVYNSGFADNGGYDQYVTEVKPGNSGGIQLDSWRVEGFSNGIASCESGIYSISESSGDYSRPGDSLEPGLKPLATAIDRSRFQVRDAATEGNDVGLLSMQDGAAYYLHFPESGADMLLTRHDLVTGSKQELLTIPEAYALQNDTSKGFMVLRSVSMNPDWVASHE